MAEGAGEGLAEWHYAVCEEQWEGLLEAGRRAARGRWEGLPETDEKGWQSQFVQPQGP